MPLLVRLSVHTNSAQPFSQTPGHSGVWKDLQFTAGTGDLGEDWLVVYDEPGILTQTRAPKERRIIFITEPPEVKNYYTHYLNQFGIAVSPMPLKGFKGVWVQRHGALAPLLGRSYDQLQAENYDEKSFDLSIVCSNARKYEQQRRRFEFAGQLKDILGERLHWFGRGVQPVKGKAEAIFPYRYSIAIENNCIEHFWTEKISDIYLGCAFPFYDGGPNLQRYFPAGSFEYIDIEDPKGAAAKIESAIKDGIFEQRIPLLKEARQKVLNEYNLFNEVWRVIHEAAPAAKTLPALRKPQLILSRKHGMRSWALDQPRRVKRTLQWLEHRY